MLWSAVFVRLVVASHSPVSAVGVQASIWLRRQVASVGWRGHSTAEGAGCLLLSPSPTPPPPPPFSPSPSSCSIWSLVDFYGRLAQAELKILQSRKPTKLYSRRSLRSTAVITVMVIRWLDADSSASKIE